MESTELAYVGAMNQKGWFDWYFKSNLLTRIFIGLISGVVLGLLFGSSIVWIKPFGDIFIRLLSMILGIDALLDMGRTSVNVTGDMVCTILVAKSEQELDQSKWR